MSRHLKRLFTPRTWRIARKSEKYITRPMPGPHSRNMCLALNVIMRDFLKIANSSREVKYILHNKEVLVDGKKRHDPRMPVGLFDVVSFPETKEHYRVVLDKKGKLAVMATKDHDKKIVKVAGKTSVKGKTQLNLSDGKCMLLDKNAHSVGDSLLLDLKDGKFSIGSEIKLEKGNSILLTGGKHIGHIGVVEDISGNRIIYKTGNDVVETLKEYAFPVGKDKPVIDIQTK